MTLLFAYSGSRATRDMQRIANRFPPPLPPRDQRLGDTPIIRGDDGAVYIASIVNVVSKFYGIEERDIYRYSQIPKFAVPRQIAFYFAIELTNWGRVILGNLFKRDRQTVWHGHKRIVRLASSDGEIAEDLRVLREFLSEKLETVEAIDRVIVGEAE